MVFLFFGISLGAKGCPRPKGPRKPVFCNFLPLGLRSPITQNVKKSRNFGEKIFGQTDFFPKVPLGPGYYVFRFLTRARNFSKCPRPKTGQNPSKLPFAPPGGPTEKEVFPKKVAEIILESVVTFFPRFLGPFCSADQTLDSRWFGLLQPQFAIHWV